LSDVYKQPTILVDFFLRATSDHLAKIDPN